MGRLLFIAFAATVILILVLISSKIIEGTSKKSDKEAQDEFMNEIEQIGKNRKKDV